MNAPGKAAAIDDSRHYPIQGGPSVPWYVMAPHESQCKRNHDQSIARMAERGGFSPAEAWCVVNGVHWHEAERIGFPEAKRRWFEFAERVNREHTALARRAEHAELGLAMCNYDTPAYHEGSDTACNGIAERLLALLSGKPLTGATSHEPLQRAYQLVAELVAQSRERAEDVARLDHLERIAAVSFSFENCDVSFAVPEALKGADTLREIIDASRAARLE